MAACCTSKGGERTVIGRVIPGLRRLKSRELYDLPPFLSVRRDQIFEFFRRSTDHYRAQFAKFAFNLGVAEDAVYLLIELANDLNWYFTLRADSIPTTRFVAGQRLTDCREIWQCWCALACCNCERSQISSFDIRYRCGIRRKADTDSDGRRTAFR
jgi:hypothetical protein